MKIKFLHRFPFYPLLLGSYPVLYLWATNYFLTPVFVVVRPLLFSLGLTGIIWLVCWIIFRDWRKASVAAIFPLALFFLYGHIYDLVTGRKIFGILVGRPTVIIGVWGLIFGAVLIWLVRTRSKLYDLTQILNLVVSFLLVMILGQLVFFFATSQTNEIPNSTQVKTGRLAATVPTAADAPDVYYILMDGYDREDLLKQDTGLDNHEFIAQLEQLGFVVPECTQSNYNSTPFAVASTFNMNYLDQLGFSYRALSTSETGSDISKSLVTIIQNNPVMQQFQNRGYQVITMQEPYHFLNFPNSDIILSDNQSDTLGKTETVRFEDLFAKTTLLRKIIPNFALEQKYQLDLYQLNQLDQITQIPGKKFVYAHLMTTHQDFAFTPDGERRPFAEETKQAYRDQVVYTNQRILKIVKNILAQSQTPPIIILQGDHGYGQDPNTDIELFKLVYGIEVRGVNQFKILNAYYLPQDAKDRLYPNITPVNTFRLILSKYFGMDYPLLPDQSIWINSKFATGYELESGSCMQ
jgi:hypothetical protein